MRHKYIVTALVLLIANICLCQDISELDKKGGFKIFKIGENKEKFMPNLINPTKDKFGYTTYDYITDNKNLKSLLDLSFDHIALSFDAKNKLQTFFIIKEYDSEEFKISLSDYSTLLNSLMNLFGKPSDDISKDEESKKEYYWSAKKISLFFTHRYRGVDKGCSISIMILSNESLKSGNTDF